jgi:hypothetical protein
MTEYMDVTDRSCRAEGLVHPHLNSRKSEVVGMATYEKKDIEAAKTISGPCELFSGNSMLGVRKLEVR